MERFFEHIKQPLAVLDPSGKEVVSLGELPFLCQIIHNKNKNLCQERCAQSTQNRFSCHCGLGVLSTPLLFDGHPIGSLVIRGLRAGQPKPDYSTLGAALTIEPGEFDDEFSKVPEFAQETIPLLESQLCLFAAILPLACAEELKHTKKVHALSLFQKLHTLLSASFEFEHIIRNVLHFLVTELPFSGAVLSLSDFDKVYLSGPLSFPREHIEARINTSIGDYSQFISDLSKEFSLQGIEGIKGVQRSLFATPIRAGEGLGATLYCYGPADLSLGSVEEDLLSVLRYRLKDIILKHTQLEQAQRSAITDRLTLVFNRRYFNDRLPAEIKESRDTQTPISLIMCDLDYFKRLNDTFGHQKGDEVLSSFGKILRQAIRKSDIPCRYGGEEFSVILPKTSLADATNVADRIRDMAEHYDFGYLGDYKMTVSIGVVCCQNSSVDPHVLLKEADTALYRAKNNGRNCVEGSLIVDKNIGAINVNAADELYVQKKEHTQ